MQGVHMTTLEGYESLFDIRMTKAEQAAADKIWKYIQDNSWGMQVMRPILESKTKISVHEAHCIEQGRRMLHLKSGYSTPPLQKAHIVSRMGSVPTTDLEEWESMDPLQQQDYYVHKCYTPDGSEVWIPTFEIAASPSARFTEVIDNPESKARAAVHTAGAAINKELDHNVYRALRTSVEHHNMHANFACDVEFANKKFEIFLSDIIDSNCESMSIPRNHAKFLSDKFGIRWTDEAKVYDPCLESEYLISAGTTSLSKERGRLDYQHKHKIYNVHIHPYAEHPEVMFLPPPALAGNLVIDHKPFVVKNRDAGKLRVKLVIFISVGIAAWNGVKTATFGKPEKKNRAQEDKKVKPSQP